MNEQELWTRASDAEADSRCPGRFQAQRGLPDTRNRRDADYGTGIHDALAGKVLVSQAKLTLEQIKTVEACEAIERKAVIQYFGSEVEGMTFKPIREQRLWMTVTSNDEGFVARHSGQPDTIYRRGTRALIVDYKSLASDIPPASRNLQERDYVALLWANALMLEEVAAVVIQPLVTHSPEICVYGGRDIRQALDEMKARVMASHAKDAPRIPGDIQCKYCRAKMKCLEYQKWAGALTPALVAFDVPISNWTPEQRAMAAGAMKAAEEFLDNLKVELKSCLQKDPESVPGFYLKPGAIRKMVVNPQAVFERFTGVGGELASFMRTITVGKDKLKTELAAASSLKGKELDQALDALLDGLTEQTQAAPSLARKKNGT